MPLPPMLLAALLALPSDQAPAAVATQVRSAALFKNGLAFVQRSGSAPANATQARIDALPIPTHGTFWITPGSGTPAIASAIARKSELVERVLATDLVQLLRANVGRKLALIMGDKDVLHGTLAALPEPPLPDDEERVRYGYMPQPVSGLLILELDGGGSTAIDPRAVTRVVGEGSPLARDYERRRPATSLSIQFAASSKAPAPFELSYLERGLTWVPSYSIDISDGGKALLSAKAEVIDEAEELAGATLLFVTGYPTLQFAHVADPIALRGNLEAFLSALGQPAGAQQSQVLSQSVMSNSLDYERGVASLPVAPEAAQGGVEDLFLYEQRDVTLARGERGLYPLFSARVPCEHVYEWEIPDTVEESQRREREGGGPHQEEIWHSLRLTNETGLPWTTAPAMTQKGGNILGQDTLRYTAVGAKTNVRITRALDIQGEQNEFEIARERNSAQFYGSSYDKVTVRGELRITNFKKEPVKLEIRKRIQGEVTKNPGKAEIVALAEGLRRVNPSTRLSWTLALEPGKPGQLEYEYTLYVRN